MKVFLFSGIECDPLELIDSAIKHNQDDKVPYLFGGNGPIKCTYFDSELCEQYEDAQALAMFIELRKRELGIK
jgi:hypothetical protein